MASMRAPARGAFHWSKRSDGWHGRQLLAPLRGGSRSWQICSRKDLCAATCCSFIGTSLIRMVPYFRRGFLHVVANVAANATAALLAKHRASRSPLASPCDAGRAYRWRGHLRGPARSRDGRALEDSKRLATQLFTRALAAAGPEILDRNVFVVAQADDGRSECRLLAEPGRTSGHKSASRCSRAARGPQIVLEVASGQCRCRTVSSNRGRARARPRRGVAQGGLGHEDRAAQGVGRVGAHAHHAAFAILPGVDQMEVVESPGRGDETAEPSLPRWVRTSIYGSFDWWRRVVVDAASAEEAQKRAARLFGQALKRWSVLVERRLCLLENRRHGSSSCRRAPWSLAALARPGFGLASSEVGGGCAAVLAGALSSSRTRGARPWLRSIEHAPWLRSSQAAAFVFWRRVVVDLNALEDKAPCGGTV